MNVYQNKLHKQVEKIITDNLKELDNKYPKDKKGYRNVGYTIEFFEIKSKKYYRYVKKIIKKRCKNEN